MQQRNAVGAARLLHSGGQGLGSRSASAILHWVLHALDLECLLPGSFFADVN